MKKIALLLVALLVLGMLAACNAEKEKAPEHVVSGYDINIYAEGWKEVENTQYDMQMVKDDVTMSMIGFTVMDFVDVPPAEELYVDANEDLLEDKSVVVATEPQTSYEKNGKKYTSTLFSAKDGDADMQYYCFMVEFDDEAGSMVWVCFSATNKVMKQHKAELKKLVESMDANGKYYTPEELEQQVQDALIEGGMIEDDSTEEMPEYTEPSLTEPAEEMESVKEETAPALEETEPVKEETEPAEEEIVPSEEETQPSEEETKPAEEQTEGETVPADQAPDAPTGETTPEAESTEPAVEATDAVAEVETTPATEAATEATE